MLLGCGIWMWIKHYVADYYVKTVYQVYIFALHKYAVPELTKFKFKLSLQQLIRLHCCSLTTDPKFHASYSKCQPCYWQ